MGGHGNLDSMLSWPRLLALIGAGVALWAAYSGPSPATPLGTYPLADLVPDPPGSARRYGRVLIGPRKLWVRAQHLSTLTAWTSSAPAH
jgi:hypothetical protein